MQAPALVAPPVPDHLPVSQSAQAPTWLALPSNSLYVPGGHLRHAVELLAPTSSLNRPRPHSVQLVVPLDAAYFPAAHGSHGFSPPLTLRHPVGQL